MRREPRLENAAPASAASARRTREDGFTLFGLLVVIVLFVVPLVVAGSFVGWLRGDREALAAEPVAVIEPVGSGDTPPEAASGRPVRAGSLAHTSASRAEVAPPEKPLEDQAEQRDAGGDGGRFFGFRDPCAEPDPPEGCPDGEPGTVLGDDPGPLAIDVMPYPFGEEGVRCDPQAPAEPDAEGPAGVHMALLIVANNPSALEVGYGPTFGSGRIGEVVTSDAEEALWEGRFSDGMAGASVEHGTHHCVTLTELVPEALDIVVSVTGEDASGSGASVERRFRWSPAGRPPAILRGTDDFHLEVSVPLHDPSDGHSARVGLQDQPDCSPEDASGTNSDEVRALSSEVLEAEGYPYDPAYTHVAYFRLPVDEGTDQVACVKWLRDTSGELELVEVEEQPVSAPDQMGVRISVAEVRSSQGIAVGPTEISVAGCGTVQFPGASAGETAVGLDLPATVCDTDGRAWPPLTLVAVKHTPDDGAAGEAEVLVRTPTMKCRGVQAIETERVCLEERTEWVEVPLPGPAGIDASLCGSTFGDCDEAREGPFADILLRIDFYDGEVNDNYLTGVVHVGPRVAIPEGTPVLTEFTAGQDTAADDDDWTLELQEDSDSEAGSGCQVQCIFGGNVHLQGLAAYLTVHTDTPAVINIFVLREEAPFYGRHLRSPNLQRGFGGWFEDLEPDTTYEVMASATDADGFRSTATGSFTTPSRHVELTFHSVDVLEKPHDDRLTASYWSSPGEWHSQLQHSWNPGRPPGAKTVTVADAPDQMAAAVIVTNKKPKGRFQFDSCGGGGVADVARLNYDGESDCFVWVSASNHYLRLDDRPVGTPSWQVEHTLHVPLFSNKNRGLWFHSGVTLTVSYQ